MADEDGLPVIGYQSVQLGGYESRCKDRCESFHTRLMFVFGNKHSLCLSFLQIGLVTATFRKALTVSRILKPQK